MQARNELITPNPPLFGGQTGGASARNHFFLNNQRELVAHKTLFLDARRRSLSWQSFPDILMQARNELIAPKPPLFGG